MNTHEQELLEAYHAQEDFMYSVVHKMKSLWSNSVYPYEFDDMVSVLKVEFFKAYPRHDKEKGLFLTYINNTYYDSIRREVSRVKNGLTYPYNTVIDRIPEIYRTLEKNEITMDALLQDRSLYNHFFLNRENFMSYETFVSFFSNQIQSLNSQMKGKESEETETSLLDWLGVYPEYQKKENLEADAIFYAELKKLPSFLIYWMIQLYKGYEIRDVLKRLGISNSAFYRNYVREHIRLFLTGGVIDYASLHEEINDRIKRTRYTLTDEEFWEEVNGVVEKEITLLT